MAKEDPLKHICPKCGSKPGADCMTMDKVKPRAPHAERRIAAGWT